MQRTSVPARCLLLQVLGRQQSDSPTCNQRAKLLPIGCCFLLAHGLETRHSLFEAHARPLLPRTTNLTWPTDLLTQPNVFVASSASCWDQNAGTVPLNCACRRNRSPACRSCSNGWLAKPTSRWDKGRWDRHIDRAIRQACPPGLLAIHALPPRLHCPWRQCC